MGIKTVSRGVVGVRGLLLHVQAAPWQGYSHLRYTEGTGDSSVIQFPVCSVGGRVG